jgi:chromosome segregation ATPase
MKCQMLLTIFAFSAGLSCASSTNPVAKVVAMVSDLQAKVIKEGEEAQHLYTEFAEMCEDRSRELHNEIKTGKATIGELTATIEKAAADITVFEEKVGDLAGTISDDEADLAKATKIRAKENADFSAEEKELMATINTIERATHIVEKEMAGGASLAQVSNMQNVAQALTAMVDAQAINSADGANLMALLQNEERSEDNSDEVGAPDPAAYKSQSGGIVDTLEGLLSKAEEQLEDVRKTETAALQAFEMQKQSLEDKIKFANKEMAEAKKSLAATSETKATAEGDLEVSKKDLAEDTKALEELHHECLTEATAFEESTKSRAEELKALAAAKKNITESTGGATEQAYGLVQTSFVQVASKSNLEVKAVRMVRDMAMSMKSHALAQLASRMQAASHSSDPFGKVKGLIKDMIEKLLDEAEADAKKKAYCDKEMAETQANQDDKESAIEKLTTKIDVMSAESKKLKTEVATLQKELAALSKTQAEMDKLRAAEKAVYDKNKPEMEQGVKGVKMALKVLRDYYAQDDKSHDSADGAGSGIIGLLEVCESDFSKGLAELIANEEAAVAEYDTATKENEIEKATKEQDAKYKTKEYVGLDKGIAEAKADKTGVNEELSAVMEYFAGIKKECIAKPEPYEEKVKRRNKEIAGLKEALEILEGEAVLLQKNVVHRTLRGGAALQADA